MNIQKINFSPVISKLNFCSQIPNSKQITMDDVIYLKKYAPKTPEEIISGSKNAQKDILFVRCAHATITKEIKDVQEFAIQKIKNFQNGILNPGDEYHLKADGKKYMLECEDPLSNRTIIVHANGDKLEQLEIISPTESSKAKFSQDGELTELKITTTECSGEKSSYTYKANYHNEIISTGIIEEQDGTTKTDAKYFISKNGKSLLIFKNLRENKNNIEYSDLYRYEDNEFNSAITNFRMDYATGKSKFQEYDSTGTLIEEKN